MKNECCHQIDAIPTTVPASAEALGTAASKQDDKSRALSASPAVIEDEVPCSVLLSKMLPRTDLFPRVKLPIPHWLLFQTEGGGGEALEKTKEVNGQRRRVEATCSGLGGLDQNVGAHQVGAAAARSGHERVDGRRREEEEGRGGCRCAVPGPRKEKTRRKGARSVLTAPFRRPSMCILSLLSNGHATMHSKQEQSDAPLITHCMWV